MAHIIISETELLAGLNIHYNSMNIQNVLSEKHTFDLHLSEKKNKFVETALQNPEKQNSVLITPPHKHTHSNVRTHHFLYNTTIN